MAINFDETKHNLKRNGFLFHAAGTKCKKTKQTEKERDEFYCGVVHRQGARGHRCRDCTQPEGETDNRRGKVKRIRV